MFDARHLEAAGPGWAPILQTLGQAFEETLAKASPDARIKILQVKEKFGTLRVYYDSVGLTPKERSDLWLATVAAETASARTCETCGSPASETRMPKDQRIGAILTLCEEHHAERDAKYLAKEKGL